jgi:hypothetical protein
MGDEKSDDNKLSLAILRLDFSVCGHETEAVGVVAREGMGIPSLIKKNSR